ncbi:hypothetical protein AVEN_92173-1 [Araneus ventricosus]|uniref:Uncharacterized protein n=1 Tax=Araneus ventricosus TaxID=182803 RepID=A0A4Y2HZA6_ARAVE|nr:hypothetical protein AVEN_104208-1 [Araneus ventricosus]GBM70816.1 hypothetical protein AVEN_92173-1 [Araneus ventricosus]
MVAKFVAKVRNLGTAATRHSMLTPVKLPPQLCLKLHSVNYIISKLALCSNEGIIARDAMAFLMKPFLLRDPQPYLRLLSQVLHNVPPIGCGMEICERCLWESVALDLLPESHHSGLLLRAQSGSWCLERRVLQREREGESPRRLPQAAGETTDRGRSQRLSGLDYASRWACTSILA